MFVEQVSIKMPFSPSHFEHKLAAIEARLQALDPESFPEASGVGFGNPFNSNQHGSSADGGYSCKIEGSAGQKRWDCRLLIVAHQP